ncbi:conserved Plasmodium protein, unknown function [Plasmodium gallinaceum]|uniref:Ribosomal silencing factor RsfS n=1 Tax=Plasmodium gallinaceum TaxID=5849 RepID=A0A1J1H103_PLAGA|nr:conserved Plasmodium protein, unknown function [Plasmodium gallinaceum]CRG97218.1 conserved Plasmodium protein, unknown function [Plasmodium gallinaceum]
MLRKKFPFFLTKRYITEQKIFDKLKKLQNINECENLKKNESEKIEIINIDDKIYEHTMFKNSEQYENEKDEEFYENIKSLKNMNIKNFIEETLDYYCSKQFKENEWTNENINKFKDIYDTKNLNKTISNEDIEPEKKEKEKCTNENSYHIKEHNHLINENMKNEKFKDKYENLTPAQKFFEENKEKLIYESLKLYNEKKTKLSDNENNHDYYNYSNDPIVRLSENYLFDYENDENDDMKENLELEKGIMPTIEQVVCILKHEKVKNIKVIDLNKCGRRDIGMFLILCTGETAKHNKKVGKLISKIFIDLDIPYISNVVYCYCNKFDDWIISHCGPLKIHIVTKELRDFYDIENLFLYPHEHFDSQHFPSFFDYTPGIPPPYLVRSNESLDAYQNDVIYQKFISDT